MLRKKKIYLALKLDSAWTASRHSRDSGGLHSDILAGVPHAGEPRPQREGAIHGCVLALHHGGEWEHWEGGWGRGIYCQSTETKLRPCIWLQRKHASFCNFSTLVVMVMAMVRRNHTRKREEDHVAVCPPPLRPPSVPGSRIISGVGIHRGGHTVDGSSGVGGDEGLGGRSFPASRRL